MTRYCAAAVGMLLKVQPPALLATSEGGRRNYVAKSQTQKTMPFEDLFFVPLISVASRARTIFLRRSVSYALASNNCSILLMASVYVQTPFFPSRVRQGIARPQ